ncbi:hypothetical protein CBS147309_6693 [Penicillium roqueforti]|nr:hypothetical protein CBS147309_6693 [Penicillium roqueforti]
MSSNINVLLLPLLPVTDNDHSAWVITVSTILLIITILATTVTVISRIRVLRRVSWSDSTLFLSCIIFIPQTVCVNVASSHGIGKHRYVLSNASFEKYSKTFFASQLLAIVVLGCSKAAVALLILSLQPFEKITLASRVALGLISTWALATLIALGRQCKQLQPWNSSPERCVNQEVLYIALGGTHMLLDVVIIVLPVVLLHQVQIIRWKRHQISALFALRILVLALTIAGLHSLRPLYNSNHLDETWNALMPAIWLQLILSSSILCTCLPTLKRVIAELQTGMMAGVVSDFFEQSISGHTNSGDRSASKSDNAIGQRSGSGSASHSQIPRELFDFEHGDSQKKIFPWLTGQVVNEGAGDGNTGVFKITPLDKIQLVVKDLRHDPSAPTMDGLRQAKFPFTMLDEKVIAPCTTLDLPGNLPNITTESALVFCVQANLIEGGLMLTPVAQHNVMDMTGQDSIIGLLSKACHHEPFTSEELAVGNMDRSHVIPLLDDSYTPGPELARQIVKPPPSVETIVSNPITPPKSTWAYIEFSAAQLGSLKALATNTLPASTDFISTDDAVNAFIWKFIARARASRLEATSESMLTRAVDMRQRFGIPQDYPGLLQNLTYNTDTVQKLLEKPLGIVAAELRSQLDSKKNDLIFNTRALATVLSRSVDKTKASLTSTVNVSSDVMLSSWSRISCYDLDFNLGLGKPEAVRRPHFTPFEGLGYLMPRSAGGEMPVGICLRDEDWERLKVDGEFTKYAKYIG